MGGGWGQGVVIKDDLQGNSAKVDSQGALRISGDVNASFSTSSMAVNDGVDTNQKATVFSGGALRISGDVAIVGGGASDGAIVDGASGSIKATVRDYTNSNPLAVVLTNASGDTYNASGGGGSVDPVGLKNASSVTINPATEDTLAERVGIGKITASIGISGDVSIKPKAGEVFPVNDNSGSLTVDGTVNIGNTPSVVIQSIQAPIDISGDVTVSATNLDIRDLTSASDSVAATQSGTWNVNVSNNPVNTKVTNGITIGVSGDQGFELIDSAGTNRATVYSTGAVRISGDIKIAGGGASDGAIVDGDNSAIKATVLDYTASNPLAVRLSDTDGNYVGAGAGTQYNDGAARGSATGTLALGDDGTNVQSVKVDTSGELQVDIASPVTIGSVTVPVGISGDVSIIPKAGQTFDVSDRAARDCGKVDIAAFDAALPAGTNNIGDVDILTMPNVTVGNKVGVHVASGLVGVSGDVNVTATNLDIRDLVVTDIVTVGKVTAPVGISGDVLLRASDVNIGNVDIVSLPAGNLGQQAMAASLSTVPASNITDATYIGDIKFGEALPAGTAAIGKLSANSGVDIGDVDVTSIASGDNILGRVYVMGAAPGLFNVTRNFTTAQTNLSLKAPASGKRILLKGLTFTTAIAGVMVASGDTTFISPQLQFAANGGAVINDSLGMWQGGVNENIRFTSNITGAHGITIWGRET